MNHCRIVYAKFRHPRPKHCHVRILVSPTDCAQVWSLERILVLRLLQLFAKFLSTPLSDQEKIEEIEKLVKFKCQSSNTPLGTSQPPGTHSALESPHDSICCLKMPEFPWFLESIGSRHCRSTFSIPNSFCQFLEAWVIKYGFVWHSVSCIDVERLRIERSCHNLMTRMTGSWGLCYARSIQYVLFVWPLHLRSTGVPDHL
jgi:hypothetical protein